MSNFSTTGLGLVGIVVYFLILLAKWAGIEVAEAELTTQVQNVIGLVSFVTALYGQYTRKDLKMGLIRK